MSPPRPRRRPLLAPVLVALALLGGAPSGRAYEISPKAKSLFRNALDENRAGNYGRALELFLDAHGEDADVLAMDDEGLLQNAGRWLDDRLAKDDSDFNAHFQLAELKMLQGLPGEALPHYDRVVKLAPGSSLANLANPLIKDIKAQLKAASMAGGGASSPGGGASSSGSSTKVSQLEDRVDILERQLSDTQLELSRTKKELAQERAKSDSSAELDRLRKENDQLKQERVELERWKTLYFQALSQGKVQVPR